MDHGEHVDPAKVVAVGVGVLGGIQGMLKIYRLLRRAVNKAPAGVTIMNGEYKSLLNSIQEIHLRQDRHDKKLDHVVQRVDGIEQRLST